MVESNNIPNASSSPEAGREPVEEPDARAALDRMRLNDARRSTYAFGGIATRDYETIRAALRSRTSEAGRSKEDR